MKYENENTEFKSKFTDGLYKEIVAFVNTDGGIVYVGVDDEGNAIGLENVDEEYTRITNGIRDAIAPDVTMFVKYAVDKNKVVVINIKEGTNKPYFLKSKGIKPSGVYVRQGASSVQASYEQIKQLIKSSDGESYEENRCFNQELTFDAMKDAFARYGVELSEEKYTALGVTTHPDRIYTNLALVLSDQCEHSIKIAVFDDEAKTIIKDRKEFTGSIFKQLWDAFDYIKLSNRYGAKFSGLERIDVIDYPEEAIREALLNAIVHRDYSFSGSIIINITKSGIEFISLGSLRYGLTLEDLQSGASQPRNKKLASIFFRLRLIESYGTGIRRIYRSYENSDKKPKIEVTSNTFKIFLPNLNEWEAEEPKKIPVISDIAKKYEVVINAAKEKGYITEPEIQEIMNVKKTQAYNIAMKLTENGYFYVQGRGAEKKYMLV